MYHVAVAARAGADDGGLRRRLRHNIWFDHLREQDRDRVHADPRASATKIVFNATGQQYLQKTFFAYLGGTVAETLNQSVEIDRRIHAKWMSFERYERKLSDHPKASLLLRARMVRSEVVEALLYGCAT